MGLAAELHSSSCFIGASADRPDRAYHPLHDAGGTDLGVVKKRCQIHGAAALEMGLNGLKLLRIAKWRPGCDETENWYLTIVLPGNYPKIRNVGINGGA
jgi:hypothetical protein